jgi:pimeloyl-[acyl-carrier protein] methyl ester esterase
MSSEIWRLQFAGLAGSFRVIAPDLAGHGRSAQSATGYSFEGFAADIVALLRHLDLADALLVGWSLGGQAVLQAFAQARERLSGLVLVAATPRFTASADFPAALAPNEAEGMARKLRRNTARAWEGFTGRMFAPGELDDPDLAEQVREVLASLPTPDTDVALQSLQALAGADMRHLLATIDLPTLIIGGDRDVICLPQASAYLAQMIPFSRRVVMSGCGHAPFLTSSIAFNDCIAEFSRRALEQRR